MLIQMVFLAQLLKYFDVFPQRTFSWLLGTAFWLFQAHEYQHFVDNELFELADRLHSLYHFGLYIFCIIVDHLLTDTVPVKERFISHLVIRVFKILKIDVTSFGQLIIWFMNIEWDKVFFQLDRETLNGLVQVHTLVIEALLDTFKRGYRYH